LLTLKFHNPLISRRGKSVRGKRKRQPNELVVWTINETRTTNENKYLVCFYFPLFLNELMKLLNFGLFFRLEQQEDWLTSYPPQPTAMLMEDFNVRTLCARLALHSLEAIW